MKFISWNVNSIRACAKNDFLAFLYSEKAEIFGVQETKAGKQEHMPDNLVNPNGYESIWFSAQKPGYSGVALFIRKDIECDITKGLGISEFDNEGRCVSAEIKGRNLVLINAYFPNSQDEGRRLDYKLRFCKAIKEYTDDLVKKGKNIILCGDYNIAHTPLDLAHPKANEKHAGYLPEERAWMSHFLSSGYTDTFRMFTPEGGHYTWWSYRTRARGRNIGWRIDYHCVNDNFKDKVLKSYHRTDIMGSDHCPVVIEINA